MILQLWKENVVLGVTGQWGLFFWVEGLAILHS